MKRPMEKPLTSEQQWRAVVATSLRADADDDAIDAMSEEELDRELRAEGMDPEELAREAEVLLARLHAVEPSLPHVARAEPAEPPLPARVLVARPRRRFPLDAAAAGLVAAGVTVAVLAHRDPPRPHHGTPETSRLELATTLRSEASEAYARGAYRECLEKLDQAGAVDPEGESSAEVVGLRADALKALSPVTSVPPADAGRTKRDQK